MTDGIVYDSQTLLRIELAQSEKIETVAILIGRQLCQFHYTMHYNHAMVLTLFGVNVKNAVFPVRKIRCVVKDFFSGQSCCHHRHIESLFAFSLAYRCTEISQCPDSHFAYFQNFRLQFVFLFQTEHCFLPSYSDLSKIFNGCCRFHTHQLLGLALRRVVASIWACSSSMLIGDSPFLPLSNHLSNSSR